MKNFLIFINEMTKKEEFYDKVLELISDKGFKATTVRDMASAMDCDVSNIYNYIPSKQAFLEEILFSMNDRFQSKIDSIISSGLSPRRQLEEIIRMYVEMSSTNPREVGLLLNEWRNLKEEKLLSFQNEKHLFEKKIAKIVRAGIKSGDFKSLNINLLSHLILSSLRLLFKHPEINRNTYQSYTEISQFIFKGIEN